MKLRKDECLILRSDDNDGVSTNGFVWPENGPVEASVTAWDFCDEICTQTFGGRS